MRHTVLVLTLFAFLLSCTDDPPKAVSLPARTNPSATDSLRQRISDIIGTKKASVGVAVMGLEDGDTISINGHQHFAMMSVAKFPQALALLHMVDQGKISMTEPLHFNRADLQQGTGSTIRKDHPQPEFDLSVPEALRYSIVQSDNITSNKFFAIEGGPKAVEAYVRATGIKEIGIATDYTHMRDSFRLNWCTPVAMVQLLEKFYQQRLLSDSSRSLLWKTMVAATSGPDRLRGLLPAGTVVGHKTGTSGRDEETGVTHAFNDVGIVHLPDGKHFAIAVFVAESRESAPANADIIAQISKAVWDYFLAKGN